MHTPYLKLENISVRYPETPNVNSLENFSIDIFEGEFIALIGAVGSGKSTLLKTLVGLLKPHDGSIFFRKEPYPKKGLKLRELRRKIGLVFQFAEWQVFEATVLDEVLFGLKNYGFPKEDIVRLANEGLKKVGLDPVKFSDKSPFELSGGERKRLALASILALEPELLLLDEPAAGLDSQGRNALLEILGNRKKSGGGLILVTHNLDLASEICDRVVILSNYRKVYDGGRDIFYDFESLTKWRLEPPELAKAWTDLIKSGEAPDSRVFSFSEAENVIINREKPM